MNAHHAPLFLLALALALSTGVAQTLAEPSPSPESPPTPTQAPPRRTPPPQRAPSSGNVFERDPALLQAALRLQERISRDGCNAHVCVALDGGATVGSAAFDAAREFAQVIAIVADVDPAARYAALQYGRSNSRVSPVTDDARLFAANVGAARFADASASNAAAGVLGCAILFRSGSSSSRVSLRQSPPPQLSAEPPRIVVVAIGAGGGDRSPQASRVTDELQFTDSSADVLAVAVGPANFQALSNIASVNAPVVDLTDSSKLASATTEALEFICRLPAAAR